MLGACLLVLAIVALMSTDAEVSREFCKTVQFDFKDPQQAFADFKACVRLDERQMENLHLRFLTTWAKYAADAGVGAALRGLEDPQLRQVLLPEGAWSALMSQSMSSRIPKDVDSKKPTFVAEITLVVVLAFLTAVVAIWTLKLKTAVQRGLPTVSQKASYCGFCPRMIMLECPGAFLKEKSEDWEPEREKLLRDSCEADP